MPYSHKYDVQSFAAISWRVKIVLYWFDRPICLSGSQGPYYGDLHLS